jgi:hypothetical protein
MQISFRSLGNQVSQRYVQRHCQRGKQIKAEVPICGFLNLRDVCLADIGSFGQLPLRQLLLGSNPDQVSCDVFPDAPLQALNLGSRRWRLCWYASGSCGHALALRPQRCGDSIAWRVITLQWCRKGRGRTLKCSARSRTYPHPKFRFSLSSISGLFSSISSVGCSPYPLAKGHLAPRKWAAGSLASGRLSPSKRAIGPARTGLWVSVAWNSSQMLMNDTPQAARLLVNRVPRHQLTSCPDSMLGDRPER